MGILVVVLAVILIILFNKNKALKGKLVAAQTIAAGVEDADAYSLERHSEADSYYDKMKGQADVINKDVSRLKKEKSSLTDELHTLDLDVLTGMVKIDAYEDLKSDEIKNQLVLLRGQQDAMVRDGRALAITNHSSSKRFVDSQKKQILRCFNSESVNLIGGITVKNIDTVRAKIQRSFDAINKIFAADGVAITQEYLASKFEELSLVYAYMVKENEEREQRKAIREQMVEEEKVRREIDREKQRIEKEETQFTNEVNKLMSYMQKATDDVERKLYIDKISELQEKLNSLQKDKENVLEREQNTRAGFVYIISNIGSFDEHVFKIGMTRRLEPMDRISELSSASVPFPFDVHAMIFSEDAPGLESILHQYFDANRVNKVNTRKEFFRVDLDEIKKVVLENHNATVKFVDVPDAMEYRETLKLNKAPVQA